MNTDNIPTPLIQKVVPFLPLVEKILLTSLLVGIVLVNMQIDSTVAIASLFGLAVTFFLLAFNPPTLPQDENEMLGFPELLGLTIIPKALWISCAVSVVGLTFYTLGLNNPGAKNMAAIGGFSIALATLALCVLLVTGARHLKINIPVLIRAVPICLIDFYVLLK